MGALLGKYHPMIYSVHRHLTCCPHYQYQGLIFPRYGLNAWNQYGFPNKYITTDCKHVGVLAGWFYNLKLSWQVIYVLKGFPAFVSYKTLDNPEQPCLAFLFNNRQNDISNVNISLSYWHWKRLNVLFSSFEAKNLYSTKNSFSFP